MPITTGRVVYISRHRINRIAPKPLAGITTLISDTFTDTNGTLISNHAISPINVPSATWTLMSGCTPTSTSIQSNKARLAQYTMVGYFLNAGVKDVTITAKLLASFDQSPVYWNPGILVHHENGTGYGTGYLCAINPKDDRIYIGEHNPPAQFWTRATSAAITINTLTEYLMTVVVSGSLVTASIGAVSVSYTMTANLTSTNFGILNGGYSYTTIDDFVLTTP